MLTNWPIISLLMLQTLHGHKRDSPKYAAMEIINKFSIGLQVLR